MTSPVTIIGAELGKALAAHPEDVEAALTEYEQSMFLRSTEIAPEATEFFESFSGEGGKNAAVIMLEMMNGDERNP